jgi:hypothetical protein
MDALEGWRVAMLSNDPVREADCYADHVDRYFLQTDVTRDYVLQYLQKMRARGDSTQNIGISRVTMSKNPDSTVEVHFVEDFQFVQSGEVKSGIVRTVLHFIKQNGDFKITFERQFNS